MRLHIMLCAMLGAASACAQVVVPDGAGGGPLCPGADSACDDGDPCTIDRAGPAGCVHEIAAAGAACCLGGCSGACYPPYHGDAGAIPGACGLLDGCEPR